jgi:hypothetical protein
MRTATDITTKIAAMASGKIRSQRSREETLPSADLAGGLGLFCDVLFMQDTLEGLQQSAPVFESGLSHTAHAQDDAAPATVKQAHNQAPQAVCIGCLFVCIGPWPANRPAAAENPRVREGLVQTLEPAI